MRRKDKRYLEEKMRIALEETVPPPKPIFTPDNFEEEFMQWIREKNQKEYEGRDGSRSGRLKKNNRWLIYSCSVIYFDLLLNVSSLYIFKKRHSKDTQTTLKRHPKDTLRPPGISGKMYHVKVDREHQQKAGAFLYPF